VAAEGSKGDGGSGEVPPIAGREVSVAVGESVAEVEAGKDGAIAGRSIDELSELVSSPVGTKVGTVDAVAAGGAVDAVVVVAVTGGGAAAVVAVTGGGAAVVESTVAAVGLGPGPPPHPGTAQGQLHTSQVE
jgi:hypothetical protein